MSRYWTSERMYPSSIVYGRPEMKKSVIVYLLVAEHIVEVQNVLGKAGYPRSYEYYYAVYKNYPEKGRITYTDKEFKDYMYRGIRKAPMANFLRKKKALVADYQCQKSTN